MYPDEAERIGQGRLLDKNLAQIEPGKWAQDECHREQVWKFMENAAGSTAGAAGAGAALMIPF